MPNKGSTGKFGIRTRPLDIKFWKKFVKETGTDIDQKTFFNIIRTCLKSIQYSIINDAEGVQLPEWLGTVVVSKYKPESKARKPTDWLNTNKLGYVVPLTNLHSFGHIFKIKWFKVGTRRIKNLRFMSFKFSRELTRGLAASIKSGNKYFTWSASDLWNITKMERTFLRSYKKEY